ncbi:hypothetical protein CLU79DRAFT_832956 [Phycomyces nitens]|nr:hypothetical protein CLU79DRAFT_832956 [Phycomyces nitens]
MSPPPNFTVGGDHIFPPPGPQNCNSTKFSPKYSIAAALSSGYVTAQSSSTVKGRSSAKLNIGPLAQFNPHKRPRGKNIYSYACNSP